MAVKLRLMRLGRKGQPFYRIVAVDARKRRDGAYLEKIGHYNPMSRPAELNLDDDKALQWLRTGAIPTDTVRNLLSRRGLMLRLSLEKKGVAAEDIEARVSQHRLDTEAKLRTRDQVSQPAAAAAPIPEAKAEPPAPAPEEAVEPAAPAPEETAEPAAPPTEAETPAEEEPPAAPTESA